MTKWEYHIINIRSENYRLDPNAARQLTELGEQGWELVSVVANADGEHVAYFKRLTGA